MTILEDGAELDRPVDLRFDSVTGDSLGSAALEVEDRARLAVSSCRSGGPIVIASSFPVPD
jgi:hypothetical protein